MWIFGYGSLIWRPDFPYLERLVGFIEGYARYFYQGSPDHRGVPNAPGRVVTLLPCEGARCHGVAFRIPSANVHSTLADLDHREKGGYQRLSLPFFSSDGQHLNNVFAYVATPCNPHYLGPESVEKMARHILAASGPSGTNREYLYSLYRALTEMGSHDDHVTLLAETAKKLEYANAGVR